MAVYDKTTVIDRMVIIADNDNIKNCSISYSGDGTTWKTIFAEASKNGFETTRERAVCEGKRVYIVMRAEYCGKSRELTDYEAFVGTLCKSPKCAEFEYFKKLSRTLERQIDGQSGTGADTLKALKEQIDSLINGDAKSQA